MWKKVTNVNRSVEDPRLRVHPHSSLDQIGFKMLSKKHGHSLILSVI